MREADGGTAAGAPAAQPAPDTSGAEPSTADPVRTDPPRTDPPRTDPLRIGPPGGDPWGTDPFDSDPLTSDPLTSDRWGPDSGSGDPLAADPLTAGPRTSDPAPRDDPAPAEPHRTGFLAPQPNRPEEPDTPAAVTVPAPGDPVRMAPPIPDIEAVYELLVAVQPVLEAHPGLTVAIWPPGQPATDVRMAAVLSVEHPGAGPSLRLPIGATGPVAAGTPDDPSAPMPSRAAEPSGPASTPDPLTDFEERRRVTADLADLLRGSRTAVPSEDADTARTEELPVPEPGSDPGSGPDASVPHPAVPPPAVPPPALPNLALPTPPAPTPPAPTQEPATRS